MTWPFVQYWREAAAGAPSIAMKTIVLFLTIAAVFAGCGGDGSAANVDTLPWPVCGSVESRRRLDQGGDPNACTAAPSGVVGTWINLAAANVLSTYTFGTDDTYSRGIIRARTEFVGDGEIERGVYFARTGKLTFVPQTWTCGAPRDTYEVGYAVTGDDLTLTYSDAIVSFARSAALGGDGKTTVTLGCFDANGDFTPAAN